LFQNGEVFAYHDGAAKTHERIRLANPDFGKKNESGDVACKVIETTVGGSFSAKLARGNGIPQ
jgi:hypothetical protein